MPQLTVQSVCMFSHVYALFCPMELTPREVCSACDGANIDLRKVCCAVGKQKVPSGRAERFSTGNVMCKPNDLLSGRPARPRWSSELLQ